MLTGSFSIQKKWGEEHETMENKNNISKLTKILFVALAMGMILISPYQLCNVAAADKYYGYQKKTKSVKTKITASKKKYV